MLLNRLKLIFSVVVAACMLMQSCKKTDDTYKNSVPESKTDLNMYDYLVSKKGTFDTLVYIINKANLADTLKTSKITFFVPTDKSILTAITNLNTNRAAAGLPALTVPDIDPFVWRMLLMRYMISGEYRSPDFALADGLDVITLNRRKLHVNAVATTTQGGVGSGSYLLKYSDLNGSRFTKDWVFSYVTTSNLQTKTGIINILEPSHVFGFRSFVQYASTLQNPYSDRYYVSSGTLVFPAPAVPRSWLELGKELKAIDAVTVETDGLDLKASLYFIRLKVNPADNTVTVRAAPSSANQDITNNGACYYDPINQEFVLNYRYGSTAGDRKVSERIKLRNY
ncbi:BT_3044 domain-containing protein [Pedobacter frigoris]|uniref:BT_3044 domain-containing protein n=1 Tax=Pedobacter frigoris TaxID=2571272 RepID=UPI00293117C2|nr:DUF4361 domain-containing protein [Pedobacter frigoris]